MECAPPYPEHIAIFGASVLLLVICCSDREQRVHVSVVVGVILVFGVVLAVAARGASRQPQPHSLEAPQPIENFHEEDRHYYPPQRCKSSVNFGRFVSGRPNPVDPHGDRHVRPHVAGSGVHRKGYHLYRGGSC